MAAAVEAETGRASRRTICTLRLYRDEQMSKHRYHMVIFYWWILVQMQKKRVELASIVSDVCFPACQRDCLKAKGPTLP
eukprot:4603839-Amphidinium_carterae.1